jgi:thioesterase domain-containing protein
MRCAGGGIVASETAQQLHAEGQTVALLALLDGEAPRHAASAPLPIGIARRLRGHQQVIRRLDARARRQCLLERVQRVQKRIERQLGKADASSRNGADQRLSLSQHPDIFHRRTLEPYRPRPYPGKLTLFRAAEHPVSAHSDAALGWRRLAGGGMEIHAVPGDHRRMIEEPHCRVLAERLEVVLLDAAENGRAGE